MSTPDESAFLTRAGAVLDALEAAVERAAEDADIDVETHRHAGMLELELPDRSRIVLNLQTPMREIWLAARSGGFHFRAGADDDWHDTRDGRTLGQVLTACLREQGGPDLGMD